MQILKRDEDMMKLRIQHEDDLWVLSQLVKGNKSAGMVSHRRDQTTGTQEGGRAKSAERKPMWIQISVEDSEFQIHVFQNFSEHTFFGPTRKMLVL